MVETISNAAQLLVTMTCCALSGMAYVKTRRQPYFPLVCFYGCFALAETYWTLYLLLYQRTPEIVSVAYVGWNTAMVFLYILQDQLASDGERAFRSRRCFLAPLLGAIPTAIIARGGGGAFRVIACLLLMVVSWQAIRGLTYARDGKRRLHVTLLVYAATELALWTVACFFDGGSLSDPYNWIDFALTASLLAIFPAARRAVGP